MSRLASRKLEELDLRRVLQIPRYNRPSDWKVFVVSPVMATLFHLFQVSEVGPRVDCVGVTRVVSAGTQDVAAIKWMFAHGSGSWELE